MGKEGRIHQNYILASKNNGGRFADEGGESSQHSCGIQDNVVIVTLALHMELSAVTLFLGIFLKVPTTKESSEENPRTKKWRTVDHHVASVI